MSTGTEHKVDRTGWSSGPWDNEPDKLNWTDEATGLPCMIVRNSMGSLCGYVAVDRNHPDFGKDYNDVPVDVHGGLTYADKCSHVICHVPEPGKPDDVWWLGFDCAHLGDLSPAPHMFDRYDDGHYRDVKYVTEECTSLAKQLSRRAGS